MTYTLTQHAEQVLVERSIRPEWLERVLAEPALIEPDAADPRLRHHLGAIAEHGNRVLRVVLDPLSDPVRIITVYFDRGMRGKL